MRTELLPPGDNPIAVNKYIISYIWKVLKFGVGKEWRRSVGLIM
jgi:hypothetical protein